MGRTKAPPRWIQRLLRAKKRGLQTLRGAQRWLRTRFLRQPATPGEAAFEEYLRGSRLKFRYEVQVEGKRKRPDFTVTHRTGIIIADVKDLVDEFEARRKVDEERRVAIAEGREDDDGSAVEFNVISGGAYNPYGPIRRKIHDAREQLREYKELPCVLVLFSAGPEAELTSPEIMFGVMYGDVGIAIPFNPQTGDFTGTEAIPRFLAGGKMLHRRQPRDEGQIQNTSISALVTLRSVKVGMARLQKYLNENPGASFLDNRVAAKVNVDETHWGVVVFENACASRPLPEDIFQGPDDERYRFAPGQGIERVFVGDRVRFVEEHLPTSRLGALLDRTDGNDSGDDT